MQILFYHCWKIGLSHWWLWVSLIRFFLTWFLGKLAEVVSQKFAQLEKPVKIISAIIIIWYNATFAHTGTLTKLPRKILGSYLLLYFTSLVSIFCYAPEKQYKQSIRARFSKFRFWRFFFRSIFLEIFLLVFRYFFSYKQHFEKKALRDCLYFLSGVKIKQLKEIDGNPRRR